MDVHLCFVDDARGCTLRIVRAFAEAFNADLDAHVIIVRIHDLDATILRADENLTALEPRRRRCVAQCLTPPSRPPLTADNIAAGSPVLQD